MNNGTPKILDEIGKNILHQLQTNARLSTAEIGRRVNLSAPAVAERITKLEEQGIIQGYRPSYDFDKLNLTIRAFIHFKASKINFPELMKLINATPEIIEWYSITGNYCVLLKVITGTSARLSEIIKQFEDVGETNTSLILSDGVKSPLIL